MRRTLQSGEFHGTRRATLHRAGVTFAETEYAPDHRLPTHAHERPFFSLLLRGRFRERTDSGTRQCFPTSVVFYPEHEPHSETFGPSGGRAFNVELGDPWLGRMKARGVVYPSGSVESRGSRLNLLMTRLYAWAHDDGQSTEGEEILLEMLAETGPRHPGHEEPHRPAWLDRIVEILHARHAEVVPVTELADEAGVHPVYAARVFRRFTGRTFGQYARELRVERACAALGDPRRGLADIAISTGFADQAHFTRHFKRITGLTPGRYREIIAG